MRIWGNIQRIEHPALFAETEQLNNISKNSVWIKNLRTVTETSKTFKISMKLADRGVS